MHFDCPAPVSGEISSWAESGRKNLKGITVFGDSMSDFGSRSAAMYKQVLYPSVQPGWSGTTFNNSNNNWQTLLRQSLGQWRAVEHCQKITNRFIGGLPSPIKADNHNPSYALGGALTGTKTIFDVMASLGQFPAELLKPPYAVGKRGIRSQINNFLQADGRDLSGQLTVIWGGGNDILATVYQQQDLSTGFEQILRNSKANLIALLRNSNAKTVLVSSGAPIMGNVDGVRYVFPYLRDLPQSWQEQIEAGTASALHSKTKEMTKVVAKMFPYATIIPFNNEYEYNWKRFGRRLGNFSDYGIRNTTESAQEEARLDQQDGLLYNTSITSKQHHASQGIRSEDGYLYFDSLHPTEAGHRMLARAMELTLEANQSAISSSLNQTVISTAAANGIGTVANDLITASAHGSKLQGLAGDDILKGQAGDDHLQGGAGNDRLDGNGGANRMHGGPGADVFVISLQGLLDGPQIIDDFNSKEGDRLMLSPVLSKVADDPFLVPCSADWQKALNIQPAKTGNLKLEISLFPISRRPGVVILKNTKTLSLDVLS
ncbi:MAG: SGNH/GDSL hydrolase family protein [Prochlorococcus sp.]|nr:SGNH/GDSL hydrolase family protein [Prochlorococcaceae cyanobacterium Fu_MAG_50]